VLGASVTNLNEPPRAFLAQFSDNVITFAVNGLLYLRVFHVKIETGKNRNLGFLCKTEPKMES